MMADKDQLLKLEKDFWTGDRAFFEQHVDGDCLIAFSTDMVGVVNRSNLAATIRNGNRWKDLEIALKGFIEPTEGIAMLTYEVRALRDNGKPYAALVSTGYARRDDGWRMIFHQHTPVDNASQ